MNQLQLSVESWILGSVLQGVFVMDRRGQLIYVNRYCEKLFGWEASSVLGRRGLTALVADIDRTAGANILDLVSKGNTWSGLFRMKRLSGEPMQTFMTASPIMDISGTVVATCATVVELERLHVPPDGVTSFASVKEANWPKSLFNGDYPGAQNPSVQGRLSVLLLKIVKFAAASASGLWRFVNSLWRKRASESMTNRALDNQEQANNSQKEVESPRQREGRLDWATHKQRVKSTLADLRLPRDHFESDLSPDSESGSGSADPSPTPLMPIFADSGHLKIRRTFGMEL